MNNISWYFPESVNECIELMNNGFRPHAGGTYLVKTSLNLKGLFDLSKVQEFNEASKKDSFIFLGAALSYHDAAVFINKHSPFSFLAEALGSAASTPLRNRISLGGSICAAPKWSDIVAPLTAAGASLIIAGRDKEISYIEYSADRDLRKNSLVQSVKIPIKALSGKYYRFTVTGFDYPIFNIALSEDNTRTVCAVSGSSGGPVLFEGKKEELQARASDNLKFNDERGMSGEYIKTRALIELERMLNKAGAGNE